MVKMFDTANDYIKQNKNIINSFNKYSEIINHTNRLRSSALNNTIEKMKPLYETIENSKYIRQSSYEFINAYKYQGLVNKSMYLNENLDKIMNPIILDLIEKNYNFMRFENIKLYTASDIINRFESDVFLNAIKISKNQQQMIKKLIPDFQKILNYIPNEKIDKWNNLSKNKEDKKKLIDEITETIGDINQNEFIEECHYYNKNSLMLINYRKFLFVGLIIIALIYPIKVENSHITNIQENEDVNQESIAPEIIKYWDEIEDFFGHYQILYEIIFNVISFTIGTTIKKVKRKDLRIIENESKIIGFVNYNDSIGVILRNAELKNKMGKCGGVIRYLPKGRCVIIHDKYKKWLKVTYHLNKEEKLEGWIPSKHVKYNKKETVF